MRRISSATSGLAVLAALLGCLLAVPSAHGAAVIGIADQRVEPLSEPLFVWTQVKTLRIVVPWNAALMPSADLEHRLGAGQAAGVETVVTFERRHSEDCRTGPCALPTPAQLRDAFSAFRARWPAVTTFSAWNEGNHPAQPTAGDPAAAARLYEVLVRTCPACRILAAEGVDIGNMTGWLRAFLAELP